MEIMVIGTGYVGLVTGVGFAELGLNVTCIDPQIDKINTIKKGISPIHEIGLTDLIHKTQKAKRFNVDTSAYPHQEFADIIIIAVGTPQDDTGNINLSFLWEAIDQLCANHLRKKPKNLHQTWVIKSTVAIGTCAKIKDYLLEKGISSDEVIIVSNPEFLRQGTAVKDFFKPERIIIGTENKQIIPEIKELYSAFERIDIPVMNVSWESSELIKYASNVFLATKISFINEIANICDIFKANIIDVSKAMGLDSRIGNQYLDPGPGYGGSCFPKDTQALINISRQEGYEFMLGKAVESVNARQKTMVVSKLDRYFKSNWKDKKIAILGLSFKPNTDDMRDAPAIIIMSQLLEKGALLHAYDPQAMNECKKRLGDENIFYYTSAYDTVKDVDGLIVMTEWAEFRLLDLNKVIQNMKGKLIVDTRNIYDRSHVKEIGFDYIGTGQH